MSMLFELVYKSLYCSDLDSGWKPNGYFSHYFESDSNFSGQLQEMILESKSVSESGSVNVNRLSGMNEPHGNRIYFVHSSRKMVYF